MYQVTSVITNMNCGLTLTYVLSSRELYVLTLKGKSCAWLDQPGLGPVHRVLKTGDRLHWEKVDLPLIWRQVCYPGGQDVHPVERNCDSFNLWPQISLILFSNQEVGSISPRCEFEWLMTDSFNQEFGRDEALQLPRLHYTCYTAFGSLLRHSSFFGALNYISSCWVYEPHGTVTCRYPCQTATAEHTADSQYPLQVMWATSDLHSSWAFRWVPPHPASDLNYMRNSMKTAQISPLPIHDPLSSEQNKIVVLDRSVLKYFIMQ